MTVLAEATLEAAGWDGVLDSIERDVVAAGELLAGLRERTGAELHRTAPWALPDGLPTFPAAAGQRARDLLGRLSDVTVELEAAMASNRRQRRLTAAVAPRAARGPVYVDAAV